MQWLATSLPVARLGLGEPSSSNARAGAKAASSWLWLDEPSAPYGGAGGPAEARRHGAALGEPHLAGG